MLWISKKEQETIRENEESIDHPHDVEAINIDLIYIYISGIENEVQ